MKRQYTTPQIAYESFMLSECIASCSLLSTPSEQFTCPVEDPELGFTIFQEDSGCDFSPSGLYDQICYHVPLAGENVFSSL